MIFKVFKNTLPALFIVWAIFISEYLMADTGDVRNSVYYLQQLKIFLSYSILGLIIGGLSGGILAVKRKKYAYSFENDIKKYSKYFFKNFGISFLTLFALVSREVINNPLLFKTTLLNPSFWFSGLFVFIKDKFSPLYFTVFFVIIIAMSIHNLARTLSIYHGTTRAAGYFSALLFSALLIFNYGFLNAKTDTSGRNIVFIGVENLSRENMTGKNIKEKQSLKELKGHSYDFENCFTSIKDPKTVLLSVLTSVSPEKGRYFDGLISLHPENKTVFSVLKNSGYNTCNISDVKFRYDRSVTTGGYDDVLFATNDNQMKAEVLLSHILSTVVFNNSSRALLFPEFRLISEYRDRTGTRDNLAQIIRQKDKNFLIFITVPDYRDHLPYPYYRLTAENEEEAYLNFLNDEVNSVFEELKRSGRMKETIICLFGIPDEKEGLISKNFRIPLYISSENYEMERKVKNNYTTLDILPTVLDAAGLDLSKYSFEGRSFFDPEFIKQDVHLTDFSMIANNSSVKLTNAEGYISKNLNIENEIFPLVPRSLIMSDMKLNVLPDTAGVKYELYDIIKDPDEKINLIDLNPASAKKMKDAFELKMRKDMNYRLINGYVLR